MTKINLFQRYSLAVATFLCSLFLFTGCSKSKDGIYVCLSPGSECYHNNRACKGLCQCGGEVIEITKDEAYRSGRRPCNFCYGFSYYEDEDSYYDEDDYVEEIAEEVEEVEASKRYLELR